MSEHSPRLIVAFEWDHVSGTWAAHLENGATIPVARDQIGGKLSNALNLFRSGVIARIEERKRNMGRPIRVEDQDMRAAIEEAIAKGRVTVIKPPERTREPAEPLFDWG
jgi:hypothetical protein